MRSRVADTLSPRVRRSLSKLGADIAIARRKRNLTAEMVASRIGTTKSTYLKVEKGNPTVSMGIYAMTLFVLGFPDALTELADVRRDDTGLLLDTTRLPKRVRIKKARSAL